MGETEVDVSQWLDPKAVAVILAIPDRTVRDWCQKKKIPSEPFGGGPKRKRYRINPKVVEKMKAEGI